jgi:hypothetical protein
MDEFHPLEDGVYCSHLSQVVDVRSLSKPPNVALNSSRNVSKSLNKNDRHSNKNVNQARAMPDNTVLRSSTWVESVKYR